jgi:hypothetical protein
MSGRTEELHQDIDRLSTEGMKYALQYLVGFNMRAVAMALEFVDRTYPEEVRAAE